MPGFSDQESGLRKIISRRTSLFSIFSVFVTFNAMQSGIRFVLQDWVTRIEADHHRVEENVRHVFPLELQHNRDRDRAQSPGGRCSGRYEYLVVYAVMTMLWGTSNISSGFLDVTANHIVAKSSNLYK